METGSDQQTHGAGAGADTTNQNNGVAQETHQGTSAGLSQGDQSNGQVQQTAKPMTRDRAWNLLSSTLSDKATDEEKQLVDAGLFLLRDFFDDIHSIASRPA